MNIQNLEQPPELSVKTLRDLAKILQQFESRNKIDFINVFQQNLVKNPEEIFDFFVKNNFIEHSSNNKWTSTLTLRSIAGASLAKRKNSEQAWDEVAKLLVRTVVLSNSLGWNIETPNKLFLFGSMLNPDKKDYGDADLSLTTERTESYEILKQIQNNWLTDFYDFTSSKCQSSYGFLDESQLKIDMMSSSKFPSIHYVHDIVELSKEANNLNNFPVLVLWENPDFIHNDNYDTKTIKAMTLSNNWKKNNKEIYSVIQDNLNKALSKLGICTINDNKFKKSCEDYMIKSLSTELTKKIISNEKQNRDVNITNKIVRLGEVGRKAIKNTLKQISQENLYNSKLDFFLFEEKHKVKELKSMKMKV